MTATEIGNGVVAAAVSWIGTPFRMNACLKGIGVDCGRFLYACHQEAGLVGVPPDFPHFPADWHLHCREERYLQILEQFTRRVPLSVPGGIAVFRYGHVYAHAAIIVDWPRVIHVLYGRTVEYADATKAPLEGRKVLFLQAIQ